MTDNKYGAYQRASHTVDEIQQVIMLYEGAISFIRQAKEAIEDKDHERRYNLINKAIAIVTGLNSCLEFNEKTEEVANALDQYYQSLDMKLLYINFEPKIEECDEVIEELNVMLEAWRDVKREVIGNNSTTTSSDTIYNNSETKESNHTPHNEESENPNKTNRPTIDLEIEV